MRGTLGVCSEHFPAACWNLTSVKAVSNTFAPGRFDHVVFDGVPTPSLAAPPRRLAPLLRPPEAAPASLGPPVAAAAVDEPTFSSVREILARAGIDAAAYRPVALARRLPALLRALRVATAADAAAAAAANPAALGRAVDTLVIGVTEFFRDPALFRWLRSDVLPDLLLRRPRPRVWSVGCSSGAELYSVALLLAERGHLAGSDLLGTDCRTSAICAAGEGWFQASDVQNVPEPLLSQYLARERGGYRVVPAIRNAVRWAVADAFLTPAAGPWDAILCRNVAIYLQPAACAVLWRKLADALAAGGLLIVGKAERPPPHAFARRGPCVFEKRSSS